MYACIVYSMEDSTIAPIGRRKSDAAVGYALKGTDDHLRAVSSVAVWAAASATSLVC